MVHTDGLVEPNMENHKIYQDYFEIFRDAFLAWRDNNIYDRLAKVTAEHWNDGFAE